MNEPVALLKKFASQYTESTTGPAHSIGCKHQRDRLRDLLPHVLEAYEGNILEIGSHVGITTNIFCGIAREYGRKVQSIDPYNGEQQGNQSVYEQFLKNNAQNSDVLTQTRISSQDAQAKQIVDEGNFCFVWIDGLHTVAGCDNDIQLCKNIPVQAVDDLTWAPGLKELFVRRGEEYGYTYYHDTTCREGYYFKP